MCFGLTRQEFLSLNQGQTTIPREAWLAIKEAGIQRSRRGFKAGHKVKRHITTVISDNRTSKHRSRHVNHGCLVHFKRSKVSQTNQADTLKVGLINARSLVNKSCALRETIVDNEFSCLAITETWLKDGDEPVISNLCPPGFTFHGAHRPAHKGGKGGGIGLVAKTYIISKPAVYDYRSFEALSVTVQQRPPTTLVLVYRPPPSRQNGLSAADFLSEIETFLTQICTQTPGDICFIGDFNLHIDVTSDPHTKHFSDILATLDLTQHVHQSTHVKGHILDLVISRSEDHSLSPIAVHRADISDHHLLTFSISKELQDQGRQEVTVRSLKKVDSEAFAQTVSANLAAVVSDVSDLKGKVDIYNTILADALDTHAPERTIRLKGTVSKPWYTDEIHLARQMRRRLERRYIKSGLEIHKQLWKEQERVVVALINKKKAEFYIERFQLSDSKDTFKILRELLTYSKEEVLPSSDSRQQLADTFVTYFTDKISAIRSQLDNTPGLSDQHMPAQPSASLTCELSHFSPVDECAIRNIVMKGAPKSCKLDPIPTALLRKSEVATVVFPIITDVVNTSLTSGSVPDAFKLSHVKPLLKKDGLNREELKNYRPVANLPFLSKVLERVVARQITGYLEANRLQDPLQSAYRAGHSTESAVLKIKSDIDSILDDGDAALVVLLDLSAAFDTIDHQLLLARLESVVGIKGKALEWVSSYLTNRSQSVVIGEASSKPAPLSVGVPQGSVLGPLLFLLYVLPLRAIIEHHQTLRHGYADDTQLYTRLSIKYPELALQSVSQMNACLSDVRDWMLANKLKINDSKTECIMIASKSSMAKLSDLNITITVGSETIIPVRSVKNLGATLDHEVSMDLQITNTIRSAYFHLRRISKIRRFLDKDTCAKVIHSCVTSRLDYHNALLTSVPDTKLRRLQVVQNNAARLISGLGRTMHISPVLYQLHWLPVKHRIIYKVLTLVHQAVHSDNAPIYMKELFTPYRPTRTLRSASDPHVLTVSKTKRRIGSCSFPVTGAKHWNALPQDLRCVTSKSVFKSRLKTHLFKQAYNNM